MTSSAQPTPPLDRDWIAARIPHSGAMCLLDAVIAWDEAHIYCSATSHRDIANPLRSHGQLAAVCGIEYAAQAMAVHGALCDAAQARPRAGFLASVRSIEAHVPRLDTIETPLDVEAERIGGDGINVLYRFTVRSGARILLTGRAAVVLDATVA
ncbi:MAG: hotdog family protein [Ralstonia sp.]|jgi:predicted hotdog family 3-hydroxylacyl-ACP dehydratase|uniref:Hotdog family protein n=2 Tax=Ralstonia pickettii TaxID=329 RepID=A0A2P4RHI9_RALPI|nr:MULTISPECIES: hotdog family protein [Ralstonia]MBA4201979.1 hydroxymyristoyl-ACP dehydratase [Ralstonia sp.]MBA4230846.1 hydroxymyristoyl-ACP dehydratase [Ralstonia sp.]MBA4235373.1 hydroxymyristoyl-ACP dehydratase [Ralstonia sp.]MBA4278624.1 hydroxymyristoyl-ACP dehydratase [Ralstonia sp.]MBA4294695.1 hydroxymyristoyl-ACP dehydratase [Ralstonia sp.]